MRFKILSLNMHKGFSPFNRSFSLHLLKKAIKKIDCDIIFLQEVIGHHATHAKSVSEWPSESQFEYLADTYWPHHAYAKNAVYNEGHHGNAILSKYPIIESETFNISTNRFEQRGVLYAKIQIPGQSIPLHAFCLHLNLFRRKEQYLKTLGIIASQVKKNEPLIVSGDFNDWAMRSSGYFEKMAHMTEVFKQVHKTYARTFPSHFPTLRLDRIYVKNLEIIDAECVMQKEWTALSDHRALFSTLEMKK